MRSQLLVALGRRNCRKTRTGEEIWTRFYLLGTLRTAMPARQKPEKKPKKTSWTKTHALVLMEACRFKFEMPEGWLPEHWGIETSVISRRRNALLPVWKSEGKKHHCMRLFTKDDFERIKPTLVKRFGEEGKGLITLENIRVRWNQICAEEGVNQVPNSKPTHKANAEAARNIAAYEASLEEYKRRNEERAKTAAEFLTRANKVMKAGQKKLDDAINKSLGEAAVTSAATALFTTIGKLQDEAATLNHREKDPRKRDPKFALLIEELESHKDKLAKKYIETEWAKEYNRACGRSKLVVTETESQSLDDGNLVVANNGAPKKRKKADEPYGSNALLHKGTVGVETTLTNVARKFSNQRKQEQSTAVANVSADAERANADLVMEANTSSPNYALLYASTRKVNGKDTVLLGGTKHVQKFLENPENEAEVEALLKKIMDFNLEEEQPVVPNIVESHGDGSN